MSSSILGSDLHFSAQGGWGKEKILIEFAENFLRSPSEGAAEGGCGGNSAAPERSAGAKWRRVSFPQNGFAQSLEYPTKSKTLTPRGWAFCFGDEELNGDGVGKPGGFPWRSTRTAGFV